MILDGALAEEISISCFCQSFEVNLPLVLYKADEIIGGADKDVQRSRSDIPQSAFCLVNSIDATKDCSKIYSQSPENFGC